MELKITIEAEGIDPVVVKVDIPIEKTTEYNTNQNSCATAWFDSNCSRWTDNAFINKVFLRCQQSYCDEKLRHNGYLFLNEVFDCLGLPRTAYGQKAGWVFLADFGITDFVNFGIISERNQGFNDGVKRDAFLEFNVRDDILKYL